MQGVQNIQINGADLLDGIGIGGDVRQDGFDFGSVSTGTNRVQEAETWSKGERTAEVIYQKPQQESKAGTAQDVMQQAGNIDAALMKKQMVVASNTTTTADCRKVEEDGFSLQQTDMETVVTVTDKIKMELAKAGVDISYFGDSLSAEQLEAFAGDAALAQRLSERIDQLAADIPVTAGNVGDCKRALEEAGELHKLNDGALKYMLDQQLEPTIANLYKAQYSGSAVYRNQDAGKMDFSGMEGQIARVIAQSGQEEDARTLLDSQWLLQNRIPLTAENLNFLGQLKAMEFPQGTDALLDRMVTAISEGRRPQDAVLLDAYSLMGQAQKAVAVLQQATDEDLAYVVGKGGAVTVQSLEQAHNQNVAGAFHASDVEEISGLLQSVAELEEVAQGASQAGHTQTVLENGDAQKALESGNAQEILGTGNMQATSEIGVAQTAFGVEGVQAASGVEIAQIVSGTGTTQAASEVGIAQAASEAGTVQAVFGAGTAQAAFGAGTAQAAVGAGDVQAVSGIGSAQVASGVNGPRTAGSGDIAPMVREDGGIQAVSGGNAASSGSGSGSAFENMHHQSGTDTQVLLITARRQLEEVRLAMTVESSYQMLKQGISVDTSSMEELIAQLKELEGSFYKNLLKEGGVEATEANVSLFAETADKLEELKEMPAYALGARNMEIHTLEDLHREGGTMQQNFQQANERYETMQTQVRKDLGDSMKKAFRNVDDILEDVGLETSPANERAVRILGYNRIAVTPENIARMKAADQQVQMAFHNLTPSVIREFISRGVNPLDMDIQELNGQAEQIQAELNIDAPEEKYSEYLYKLEQNHSITQEERSSYVGIYRLMNQIAKSDGAAVGALVHQGAQITMRNLLAAVRTQRYGELDVTVDNSYGELKSGGYLDSITDQIEAGYQNQCAKQAFDELSPERLRTVANDAKWEDLTPEQFLRQLQEAPEDMAAQESYYRQQLEDLAECAKSSKEAYQVLERYDIPNTMLNVMAVSEFLNDRNSAYRRFFSMGNGRTPNASKNTGQYMEKKEDGSVEVDFGAIQEELLRRFGEDVKKPKELAEAVAQLAECAENCMRTMIMEPHTTSLDIRGLKLMNAQMAINTKMASSECFSMPIVVDGEVTNVTMKIVRGKEQKGLVNITLETGRLGRIAAELRAKQTGFSGYVASDSRQTRDLLKSMEAEIGQALQEVDDGPLDVNYIFSSGLDLHTFETKSGESEEPESEELREVQTKTLYGMAEAFIRVLRHLDAVRP